MSYNQWEFDPDKDIPKATYYRNYVDQATDVESDSSQDRRHPAPSPVQNPSNESSDQDEVADPPRQPMDIDDDVSQASSDESSDNMWGRDAHQHIFGNSGSDTDVTDDENDQNNANGDVGFSRLRNFLNDEDNNVREDVSCKVSKVEVLFAVLSFALVYNLNQEALTDLLKMINTLFGVTFLPSTRYLLDRLFEKNRGVTYHACCPFCNRYVSTFDQRTRNVTCTRCNRIINVRSPTYRDFFAMIDVKKEISHLLESNWADYQRSIHRERAPGIYTDITDGVMYKNFVRSLPAEDQLRYASCTFNTDGVPVFKSSNNSIWPIQLIINELPYSIRTAHPITCAIWFGRSKPNMNIYLERFVEQMNDLETNGIECTVEGVTNVIKLFVICSCVDSMARAPMQGVQQCTGTYSCNWCYHPGTYVRFGDGGAVKFTIIDGTIPHRTHESMLEDVEESHITGLITRGVNRTSRLLGFRFFDIVRGFVPDYMHFLCLGIAKAFLERWLAWMTPAERLRMDAMMESVKVPTVIQRLSRPVSDRKYWKAKEWENWILYYSLPIIYNIESLAAARSHWALLVKGFRLLMKPIVTTADLQVADGAFRLFVVQTEHIYGPSFMSFNLHQLLHVVQSVVDWGPLWAHSGYCFENNNGLLKANIHSPKGVISQLCRYVAMCQGHLIITNHVDNLENSPIPEFVEYLKYKRAKLTSKIGGERFFGPHRNPSEDQIQTLNLSDDSRLYSKMVKYACQFNTTRSRASRSDCSHCQLRDGRFIRVIDFVADVGSSRSFVVFKLLAVEIAFSEDRSFFYRFVEASRANFIIDTNEIETICVALDIEGRSYLTTPPNLFRN